MHSIHSHSGLLSCSLLVVLFQLAAGASNASAHALSLYTNMFVDGSTVHGYTDLWESDNPGGCHGADFYQTYATLIGPTGDSHDEQNWSTHVSLPAVEGGYYDFFSDGAVYCSCGGNAYAGNVWHWAKITTTYYSKDAFEYPTICYYTPLACSSGSPSCTATTPLAVTNPPKPCAPYRAVVFFVLDGDCHELGSFGTPSNGACT